MNQALDYYLKGEIFYQYFDRAANAEARRLFAAAIAHNPNFARAQSDLAYAMLHAWLFGWDDSITIAGIRQQAEIGKNLDTGDYYGHWVLADICLYACEFDLARDTHDKARKLAQNQAIPEDLRALHCDWADLLLLTGKSGEAIGIAEKAIADSAVPEKWFHWVLGWARYQASDYAKSLAALYALHNPRNAIRKNVVANHAALAEAEKDKNKAKQHLDDAKEQAKKFLLEEKAQGIEYAAVGQSVLPKLLALEDRIPFEQTSDRARWKRHIEMGFDGVVQP